jgi:regulatory protein
MAPKPVQASLPLGLARGVRAIERAERTDKQKVRAPREADPVMAKAGRILARRAHSTQEVREKLWAAGVSEDDIGRAIARLTELGLLDDLSFAKQWVEERSRKRGLAKAALLHELEGKGVAAEIAERAVGEAGLDEETQAAELAVRYLKKVSGKPPLVQAQRIQAMLLRKGFSMEAALTAAKAVLPPEGWD